LVWKDDMVFAVDPKGRHLLMMDSGRKLLNIQDEKGQRKILVRLITRGRWSDKPECLNEKDPLADMAPAPGIPGRPTAIRTG
jgi:hypothetical protein